MAKEIKAGDFVYYNYPHGGQSFGRVKRIDGDIAFVVFHCNGDWADYKNYTAANCKVGLLTLSKNN